jgi:hypothetical protein
VITIKKGDLFASLEDSIVIPHCVNNLRPGVFGSGFAAAINKNLGPKPREMYMGWSLNDKYKLGSVGYVHLNLGVGNVVVAHMWAQHQTIRENSKPVRYAALVHAMEDVAYFCKREDCKIFCPWFCTGLAAGKKEFVRELIEEIWGELDVTVFDY